MSIPINKKKNTLNGIWTFFTVTDSGKKYSTEKHNGDKISNIFMHLRPEIILVTIIVLHISLFFLIGIHRSVWIDEDSSLKTSVSSPGELYRMSMHYENQAPLYFFILKAWRLMNSSILHARILSLVFSILALSVFYKLSNLFFSRGLSLVATLLLSLNPFFFTASFTIRGISLSILLGILVLFFYYKTFYSLKSPKPAKWFIFGTISATAIFTHYYLAFLLLALGITLLIQKGTDFFLKYLLSMVLPVFILMIFYFEILTQVQVYTEYVNRVPSLREYFSHIISILENYLIDYKWLGFDLLWRYVTRGFYFLVFCIPLAYFILRNTHRWQEKHFSLLINFILVFCLFSVLYFFMTDDFVMGRHTIPMFILLSLVILLIINEVKRYLYSFGLFIVFFTCYVISLFNMLTVHRANGYIMANTYINSITDEQSALLFYPAAAGEVFKYYYTGEIELEFIPKTARVRERYDVKRWIVNSRKQAVEEIRLAAGKADRIIWLSSPWLGELHGINFEAGMFGEVLDSLYEFQSDTLFLNDLYVRFYLVKKEPDK